MSLSDIIGRLGLEAAPTVALVLFLAAFVLILVGAFARSRRQEFADAARLPLVDDDPPRATGTAAAPAAANHHAPRSAVHARSTHPNASQRKSDHR